MTGSSRPYYWGFIWLVYTVGGMLVPATIGSFFVAAFDTIKLGDFTDGGQFGFYSAGLLMSTLFLLAKPTSFRIPWTEWLVWVAAIGLIFATLFFALGTLYSKGEDLNAGMFRIPSIILFIVSLVASWFAVVQEYLKTQIDPIEENRTAQERLAGEFKRTEDTSRHGGVSS